MYFRWVTVLLLLNGLSALAFERCRDISVGYGPDVPSGIFKSPGFPTSYCSNLKCVYEIEPKAGFAVSLSIEFFDTEYLHDFVEIYQTFYYKDKQYSAKQHVLSGPMGHQPRHFTSSEGGGLKVVFSTDATENEFSGFKMFYSRFDVHLSNTIHPCPFPFYQAEDNAIALPANNVPFHHDTACVIMINSTLATEVTVRNLSTSVYIKLIETENFRSNRVNDVLENLNGFTTHDYPHIVSSRTESLTIIISFTQSPNASEPYLIEYKRVPSVCSCKEENIQVDETFKTLTSPGYPFEYCDNINCTTRVSAQLHGKADNTGRQYNTVVQAVINNLSIEMDTDFLQLIDKTSLLNLTDDARGMKVFTFDHKDVDFRFLTDHSVVEKGFNLSVRAYKKPYFCACPDTPKIFSTTTGAVNHTFYEDCKFMDCFWRIYPPPGESLYRIVLKINYKLTADNEFIAVMNGEGPVADRSQLRLEADAILDDGGTAERFLEFDGSDPYVQLWYHREGDDIAGERKLNINYSWRKRCQCGSGDLVAKVDDWTLLTSPDYPTPYCDNMDCTWHLRAPEGHRVIVNITDFLTEIDQDFLGIFNGNTTNTTHLELLSGMEQLESLVSSEGNELTILFTSDLSLSLRGFSLWYKAEPISTSGDDDSSHPVRSVLLFLMFVIGIVGLGTLAYLVKTDRMPSNMDLRSIRFINPNSNVENSYRRTESEASLMNPIYRPASTTNFR
uniref:CUB domain-containing protein n=1 Tax=Panagrellus redivivus TaxID=6233 RepID=A0A7E4VLR8_PANRE